MEIMAAVAAAALLVGLGVQGWLLVQVRDQQHRVGIRLDLLTRHAGGPGGVAVQANDRLPSATAGPVAPDFSLAELGGGQVSLKALLARAQPVLLVFTHPQCGPCYELLPDIGGWQRVYGDRLTTALISSGTPEINHAMTVEYGIRPVLLEHENDIVDLYGLDQAPAAVLVGPDGLTTAGSSYGTRAIRQLVADALGLVLPAAPAREARPVSRGEAAPPVRRPDLFGNVVDLAAYRGSPTLLLFWSPGCSHCQDVLPDIKAIEQSPHMAHLLIVSSGPLGLNQEVGFASPVVLDDDRSIAQAFGVSGTPAALLIDSRGVVVTPVARGSDRVRAALNTLVASASPARAAD
jgi:thiol-disulfide isomerase/thioredoxin